MDKQSPPRRPRPKAECPQMPLVITRWPREVAATLQAWLVVHLQTTTDLSARMFLSSTYSYSIELLRMCARTQGNVACLPDGIQSMMAPEMEGGMVKLALLCHKTCARAVLQIKRGKLTLIDQPTCAKNPSLRPIGASGKAALHEQTTLHSSTEHLGCKPCKLPCAPAPIFRASRRLPPRSAKAL